MQKFVEIPHWLPTAQHKNQAKLILKKLILGCKTHIEKKKQQGEMGTSVEKTLYILGRIENGLAYL